MSRPRGFLDPKTRFPFSILLYAQILFLVKCRFEKWHNPYPWNTKKHITAWIASRQSAELWGGRKCTIVYDGGLIVCTIVCIAKLHAVRATAVYVRCARNLQMQALASFFACGQHRKGGSARKACGCFLKKTALNPPILKHEKSTSPLG